METDHNLLASDIQVDSIAASHLKETASWAKLLGITGFVLSIILALAGIFAGGIFGRLTPGVDTAGLGIIVSFIYALIAAVYFALSLFMFRFSTKMKAALLTIDQENFNNSLYNLKMVYRITGVIVIIYLALVALVLVVALFAAAFAP